MCIDLSSCSPHVHVVRQLIKKEAHEESDKVWKSSDVVLHPGVFQWSCHVSFLSSVSVTKTVRGLKFNSGNNNDHEHDEHKFTQQNGADIEGESKGRGEGGGGMIRSSGNKAHRIGQSGEKGSWEEALKAP